jgi:hypothetical protein
MLRPQYRWLAAGLAAAVVLAGCGAGSARTTARLPPRVWAELRDSAEQASLKCNPFEVAKINPWTFRRECMKRTREEQEAALRQLFARCHGGPELFKGEHFVRCVKR